MKDTEVTQRLTWENMLAFVLAAFDLTQMVPTLLY